MQFNIRVNATVLIGLFFSLVAQHNNTKNSIPPVPPHKLIYSGRRIRSSNCHIHYSILFTGEYLKRVPARVVDNLKIQNNRLAIN